jgi:hypothetical protein
MDGSTEPLSNIILSHFAMGEPERLGDGNSSVAPPAVYGRGLYPKQRGIGCVSCASKDGSNIALLYVFVNS